jgi:hypothetical protein
MFGQPCLNSNPLLFATVFQGIGNQILHALRKGREVANDPGQVRLDLLLHAEPRRSDESCRAGKRGVENLR